MHIVLLGLKFQISMTSRIKTKTYKTPLSTFSRLDLWMTDDRVPEVHFGHILHPGKGILLTSLIADEG